MKKMTRLMAMLLSLLVLFQSAALADGTTAVSSDAVTEELYQGWVETATTYAAADDGIATVADNTVGVSEVTDTFDKQYTGSWFGSSNGTSKVILAIKQDGKIPGEPATLPTDGYTYYRSDYTVGGATTFANCPEGIINRNIVNYQNFIFTAVDGSKTAGLVDSTGETTKQVLSNQTNSINFERVLDAVAAEGDKANSNYAVYVYDGETDTSVKVTSANKSNYKIVCYVVKLQFDNWSAGWHIDCVVVPKEAVTLSYNINIPDGYVISTSGVGVPNSATGFPPAEFDVGTVAGLTTLTDKNNVPHEKSIRVINPVVPGDDGYIFMFQGWNTKADGSGEWYQPTSYQPDSSIIIEEDTVLYAIWNSNPAFGTGNLEIQKIVSAEPELSDADKTTPFTFKVEISNAEPADKEFDYVIYNADTVQVGIGKIKSGGTVTLKHSQYVEIKNIPAVNDDNGEPNVTITELPCEGYTPSWEGGTTTATIQGGRDSRVTCTNVAAPRNTTVTITKQVEGNMGDRNKEFPLTITVDGTANATYTSFTHGSEYTIEVPIGSTVTVTEGAGTYSPEVTVTNGTATVTEESNTATIQSVDAAGAAFAFVNTKNENVDTGILLDSLPYVLILVLVGGGVVLWLANRRRRRED